MIPVRGGIWGKVFGNCMKGPGSDGNFYAVIIIFIPIGYMRIQKIEYFKKV